MKTSPSPAPENLELRFSPGEPEPHIEEDEFHNDASKKVDDASSTAVVGLTLVKAVLSSELLAI